MEQRAKVAGKIAAAAVFRKFIESQKKKTMAKKKSKKMAVGGVAKKRNYRKEYDNYHANPTQIKRRTSRNAARGALMKNGNPSDNRRGNLTLQRPSQNRSFARTKTAGKRNRRA